MLPARRAIFLAAFALVPVVTACKGPRGPVRWTASRDGPATIAPGAETRVRVNAIDFHRPGQGRARRARGTGADSGERPVPGVQ